MVERPIKKSEREAMAATSHSSEEIEAQPGTSEGTHDFSPAPENQGASRPKPVKDRGKGKGKGKGQQKDEQSGRQPMNPALMRGPKPTKPKAPVIQEADQGEAAEDREAVVEPEET